MNQYERPPEQSELEFFDTSTEEQDRLWNMVSQIELMVRARSNVYQSHLETQLDRDLTDADRSSFANLIKQRNGDISTPRTINEIIAEYDLSKYQFAQLVDNKRVLDIGSGRSNFASQIAARKSNTEVVSVDINERALREDPNPRAVANAEFLPFRSGEFDTAIATWSLPFWANSPREVRRSFVEIKRVVRKGGHILFTPVTGIFYRPARKDSPSKISIGGISVDGDPKVTYMVLQNQLRFLELLKESRSRGELEVILKSEAQSGSPKSAILKKLK